MFLVLKTQTILDIKNIVPFYEKVYYLYTFCNLNVNDLYPIGYKEIYAFTFSDLNINGRRLLDDKISLLKGKENCLFFRKGSVISKTKVSDSYENALIYFISKKKLSYLPDEMNTKLFRDAAKHYKDDLKFISAVYDRNNKL